MKQKHFHISLYIIIPVIFTGIALLSGIVAYQVTEHVLKKSMASTAVVYFWVTVISVAAFFCGLVVVRLILKPVERFVETAKKFSIIARPEMEEVEGSSKDDLEHFTRVFEQVTDVLSELEAMKLFPHIVGRSRSMRAVFSQVLKVAPTDSTVLIAGESGTGKELVATSIHEHSQRKEQPFIKLNCVAIPEGLWESELFGYEKGAFTGAEARKPGKFEMADAGTLFLDEVGDMPLSTQAKILRVLQEREFERVGGTRSIKVDVRFIAATNKNLEHMVREGKFREDLYYRINTFILSVPPLRERTEDIPLLVEHFLQSRPKAADMSPKALEMMMGYPWPGNVRELQNTVERAVVMCGGEGAIGLTHLPPVITGTMNGSQTGVPFPETVSMDARLQEIEKGMILEGLRRAEGIQVKAAEILGLNQRSLWHRIKKYNIDVRQFKAQ
jgi:transcriptional regulator with PAS, ATPase and Fis domain